MPTEGNGDGTGFYVAIRSLRPTDRFLSILEEQPEINDAITHYKETMLKELAASTRG